MGGKAKRRRPGYRAEARASEERLLRRLGLGRSIGTKGLWREIRQRLGDKWCAPAAEVLAPCLEALRVRKPKSAVGQVLRCMVIAACDPARRALIHPAYASVAGQLAEDEVKLILAVGVGDPVLQRTAAYDLGHEMYYVSCSDVDLELGTPRLIPVYLNHLRALNVFRTLAAQPPGQVLGHAASRGRGYLVTHEMALTEFGRGFFELIAPHLVSSRAPEALRFPLSESRLEETLVSIPLATLKGERLRRMF